MKEQALHFKEAVAFWRTFFVCFQHPPMALPHHVPVPRRWPVRGRWQSEYHDVMIYHEQLHR